MSELTTTEFASPAPEQLRRDLIAATIENDQRDAYEFVAKINNTEGLHSDDFYNDSARLQGERAAELVDAIDADGEDVESAKAELAGLEGQAYGFRLASAEYAIEDNAHQAGIDYLKSSYDEIGDDNTKMLTDQFAHTMARVMATNQYSDKQKESWNFPSYASKDGRVGEQDYAAAVENLYKLAGVERNPEPAATGSLPDNRTETVYATPTKYGFSIRESRSSDGAVAAGLIIDKEVV